VGSVATILGTAVLLGAAAGVGWALTTPKVVEVVVDPPSLDLVTGAGLSDPTQQIGKFFVGEVWFAIFAVVAGVIAGFLARRRVLDDGAVAVVALAVGGLVGGLIAFRLGAWVGPGAVDRSTLEVGDLITRPLRLRSTGFLILWPIAALMVSLWTIAAAIDGQHRQARR
jgi:hypothetical protein